MLDAMREYLRLAGVLTTVPRERAAALARAALDQAGLDRQQLRAAVEDLAAVGRTSRNLVGGLLRAELDRTAAALGMVSGSDVARVSASLDRLERRLAAVEAAVEEPGVPVTGHHGSHAPPVTTRPESARRATPSTGESPPAAKRRARGTAAPRGASTANRARAAAKAAGAPPSAGAKAADTATDATSEAGGV